MGGRVRKKGCGGLGSLIPPVAPFSREIKSPIDENATRALLSAQRRGIEQW